MEEDEMTETGSMRLNMHAKFGGHRWKNSIKMNFREIGCGCMDWTDPTQIGTSRELI
jgi:hypothetical protein